MLIPVSFPIFPAKTGSNGQKRRSSADDDDIDQRLDGATLAEREKFFQLIRDEQQSAPALGNLSLTFPNYINSIENQYRKVDIDQSKKHTKLIGYHFQKKYKPSTGNPGWRMQANMRSEYHGKKNAPNSQTGGHINKPASPSVPARIDQQSSGDFQVVISSAAGLNEELAANEKRKEITELAEKIEKKKS